jgi:hypothetical protein
LLELVLEPVLVPLPLDPLPLLPEPELPPELEPEPPLPLLVFDLLLPPSFANSCVVAMPSDNKATAQTIDFLNFNMVFPLKLIN